LYTSIIECLAIEADKFIVFHSVEATPLSSCRKHLVVFIYWNHQTLLCDAFVTISTKTIGNEPALISIENKIRDIIAIDAGLGLMAFLPNSGHVEVSNSIFYGDQSWLIPDCFGADCDECITKQGLMIPVYENDEMFSAGG
jgi:hypothetical protein